MVEAKISPKKQMSERRVETLQCFWFKMRYLWPSQMKLLMLSYPSLLELPQESRAYLVTSLHLNGFLPFFEMPISWRIKHLILPPVLPVMSGSKPWELEVCVSNLLRVGSQEKLYRIRQKYNSEGEEAKPGRNFRKRPNCSITRFLNSNT